MIKRTLILLLLLVSAACHTHRPGPFERTGARLDEIKDNVEEGKPVLHKKRPLEKAGEAIDDALDNNDRD